MPEPLHSGIYEGWVGHRRFLPRAHHFRFKLFMLYLDLDELDDVFSQTRLFRLESMAPATFRRRDYLGPESTPLKQAVHDVASAALGRPIDGPVRMLTHLRYWGLCFNPVTFYYCMDAAGEHVDAIVAEITNTPWAERHTYVLDGPTSRDTSIARRFDKEFHVSPFMPMDLEYDWRFNQPDSRISVHMNLDREGERVFDASLALERIDITPGALRRCLLRHVWMSARVVGRIHFEALRLWLKRVPVQPHPKTLASEGLQ